MIYYTRLQIAWISRQIRVKETVLDNFDMGAGLAECTLTKSLVFLTSGNTKGSFLAAVSTSSKKPSQIAGAESAVSSFRRTTNSSGKSSSGFAGVSTSFIFTVCLSTAALLVAGQQSSRLNAAMRAMIRRASQHNFSRSDEALKEACASDFLARSCSASSNEHVPGL